MKKLFFFCTLLFNSIIFAQADGQIPHKVTKYMSANGEVINNLSIESRVAWLNGIDWWIGALNVKYRTSSSSDWHFLARIDLTNCGGDCLSASILESQNSAIVASINNSVWEGSQHYSVLDIRWIDYPLFLHSYDSVEIMVEQIQSEGVSWVDYTTTSLVDFTPNYSSWEYVETVTSVTDNTIQFTDAYNQFNTVLSPNTYRKVVHRANEVWGNWDEHIVDVPGFEETGLNITIPDYTIPNIGPNNNIDYKIRVYESNHEFAKKFYTQTGGATTTAFVVPAKRQLSI